MDYNRPFGTFALGVFVALGFMILAFRGCGDMLGL